MHRIKLLSLPLLLLATMPDLKFMIFAVRPSSSEAVQ